MYLFACLFIYIFTHILIYSRWEWADWCTVGWLERVHHLELAELFVSPRSLTLQAVLKAKTQFPQLWYQDDTFHCSTAFDYSAFTPPCLETAPWSPFRKLPTPIWCSLVPSVPDSQNRRVDTCLDWTSCPGSLNFKGSAVRAEVTGVNSFRKKHSEEALHWF